MKPEDRPSNQKQTHTSTKWNPTKCQQLLSTLRGTVTVQLLENGHICLGQRLSLEQCVYTNQNFYG